ncbi:MAG: hypothetical protein BA870_08425 [Desulfuromonadales bacterium C00003094]|nr:MAG: hypothetical protein BA870_08425 [Desulfuromonadales bacterium C00003094]OEU73576.1 MAG: hypothetical protein BA869_12670 [Desulfuromonadales bacterium C00003107]
MKKQCVILSLLLALTACSGVPFVMPDTVAVRSDVTATQLATSVWTAQQGVFQLRQTVLFEFRGARVPMAGLMRLDLTQGQVRLVALNDLGVKLFDLEVTQIGEQQHYLLPDIAKIPHFTEAVAASVRRVFLTPRPDGSETLRLTASRCQLTRSNPSREIRFTFGGNGSQLLATEVDGDQEDWMARYFEYQTAETILYPRGIVLDDRIAGYRLTLWQEEVKRIDE